jgi:hypothetical protein
MLWETPKKLKNSILSDQWTNALNVKDLATTTRDTKKLPPAGFVVNNIEHLNTNVVLARQLANCVPIIPYSLSIVLENTNQMIPPVQQSLFRTPDIKKPRLWLQVLQLSMNSTPYSPNKLNILVPNCAKSTNIVQSLLNTSAGKVDILLLQDPSYRNISIVCHPNFLSILPPTTARVSRTMAYISKLNPYLKVTPPPDISNDSDLQVLDISIPTIPTDSSTFTMKFYLATNQLLEPLREILQLFNFLTDAFSLEI